MSTLEVVKERPVHIGQKVKVYLNWNKGYSVYSVVDTKTGLVVAYCSKITLKDAIFKVSESGRQRVLKNQCKNVHAYVVGTLVAFDSEKPVELVRKLYYDPYKTSDFVDSETGEAVKSASLAHLQDRRVWTK